MTKPKPRAIEELKGVTLGEWEELKEKLAELEHDQWISWSQAITTGMECFGQESKDALFDWCDKKMSDWKDNWKPYSDLTEKEKDKDRKWGDKVIFEISSFLSRREREVRGEIAKKIEEMREKTCGCAIPTGTKIFCDKCGGATDSVFTSIKNQTLSAVTEKVRGGK